MLIKYKIKLLTVTIKKGIIFYNINDFVENYYD